MSHYNKLFRARRDAISDAIERLGVMMDRGEITDSAALVNATMHQARATLLLGDAVRQLVERLEDS